MNPIQLEKQLNKILRPWDYRDFCHNGLQVEGNPVMEIEKVLTAVTISNDVIDQAIKVGAHAIIVHHGWLWKPETGVISGGRALQVAKLLEHNISLYGYHLPLDMHEEYGNMVQLMKELDIDWGGRRFGADKIVFGGHLKAPTNLNDWVASANEKLGGGNYTLVNGNADAQVRNIAVVTGGGQRFLSDMIKQGNYDLFISGEVQLPQHYEALENDVAIVALGHHRTERYGVKALGEMIQEECGITAEFYDDGCPL